MPLWKKVLYGFIGILVIMILAGNGDGAADLTNNVIGWGKSAAGGLSDFFGGLEF